MTETSTGPGDPGEWTDAWEQTRTLLLLRELTRVAEQTAPAIARRAALTHNELRAMEHLMDRPMGPGELARVLGVSSAAASGIIDRLETRGHVERSAHASDGRRTSVTVRASGREEMLAHLMPMFRELAELDAGLDDQERAAVDRYLAGAVRALRTLL